MDIKTISLPLPSNEYDSIDQQVTRRITEQAIETISSRLNSIEKLDSNQLSNAIRKKQFLLMGATEQASKLTTTAEIADGAVTSAKLDTNIAIAGTLDVAGAVVFNEGSADVDFRVEGNARANLLVVDGGKDMIGVGMQPDQSWGSNSVGINFGIADGDAGAITWQEISGADSFNFSWNAYNDNTNWKYASGNPSSRYYQLNGEHVFTSAVAGSADANITFLENLSLSSGASVFNDGSVDMDFRVESNGSANMLFVDGGNNEVLVQKAASGGTATAGSVLIVEGDDNTELSLLGGSSSVLAINFGHSGDVDNGIIAYNTTSGSENMAFTVNAAESFRIISGGDTKFTNAGATLTQTLFADSGSSEGSANITFNTDGGSADESVANILMRQGSGDGGSRKGEMLFQVSDNGAPTTAMSIANNKLVTTADKLLANGGVYISAFDGDKLITDASQGGGSDALYIGNAQIQVSSDERIKKDVVNTAINATEELKKVRVVDFTWNDPTDQSYNNKNARGKWTGAIAQELISVFPHIINAPRDKDTLEVDNDSERKWLVEYQNLVPVLIKAIQELSAKNDALEARIKTLEDA